MMRIRGYVCILVLTAAVVMFQSPAYADLWRLNEQLTIRQNDNTVTINRNLQLKGRHIGKVVRGSDLSRAIKDLARKTKEALAALKWRRLDQARGAELNRITQSNTEDTIRRNKLTQAIQKSAQRAMIRDLKAKNRNLNQRIRDLSRR